MTTEEKYKHEFTGTITYYKYINGYAYTDAIKFLSDHLKANIFDDILKECISFMAFNYNFGFYKLIVKNCTIYLERYNDDGDCISTSHIINYSPEEKSKYTLLDDGEYKIWVNNYVIFGSSEY